MFGLQSLSGVLLQSKCTFDNKGTKKELKRSKCLCGDKLKTTGFTFPLYEMIF